MKDEEDAISLAREMVNIGKLADRNVTAIITDMNQPLGKAVGNALEIREVNGHRYATRILMSKAASPDEWTEIVTKEISFGVKVPDNFYSVTSLSNPRTE